MDSTPRNYVAAALSSGLFPMNMRADMNPTILPNIFPCPNPGEQVVQNMAVTTIEHPVPLLLAVPSKAIIEGKRFEMVISGKYFKRADANHGMSLRPYLGSSMDLSRNMPMNQIEASETAAVGAMLPFDFRLQFVANTSHSLIADYQSSLLGAGFVADAVVPTLTALSVNFRNDPVLPFLLTVNPAGPASPLNFLRIDEFSVNF